MQLKQPAPLQCGDTRSVLHASEQGGATPRLSRLPGTGDGRPGGGGPRTPAAFPQRRILQEPSVPLDVGKTVCFPLRGEQERHQRLTLSFLESPKGGTALSQRRDWGEWLSG